MSPPDPRPRHVGGLHDAGIVPRDKPMNRSKHRVGDVPARDLLIRTIPAGWCCRHTDSPTRSAVASVVGYPCAAYFLRGQAEKDHWSEIKGGQGKYKDNNRCFILSGRGV